MHKMFISALLTILVSWPMAFFLFITHEPLLQIAALLIMSTSLGLWVMVALAQRDLIRKYETQMAAHGITQLVA